MASPTSIACCMDIKRRYLGATEHVVFYSCPCFILVQHHHDQDAHVHSYPVTTSPPPLPPPSCLRCTTYKSTIYYRPILCILPPHQNSSIT